MVKKLLIWCVRITSASLVFIAPVIYLIWKYGGTETVESTQSSMPILILVVISIFVLITIMWLSSQVIVVYWEYVKKHPFGFISILSFGSIILLISVLGIQWINKLSELINYNTERFITDLNTYKGSMGIIIAYVSIGLLIGLAGFIYEKTT